MFSHYGLCPLDLRSTAQHRRESYTGDHHATGHDCIHVNDRREYSHHFRRNATHRKILCGFHGRDRPSINCNMFCSQSLRSHGTEFGRSTMGSRHINRYPGADSSGCPTKAETKATIHPLQFEHPHLQSDHARTKRERLGHRWQS